MSRGVATCRLQWSKQSFHRAVHVCNGLGRRKFRHGTIFQRGSRSRAYWAVSRIAVGPFQRSEGQHGGSTVVLYQVESGSGIISEVLEHRTTPAGTNEFHVARHGTPLRTWVPSENVKAAKLVIDYCTAHDLPAPGSEKPKQSGAGAASTTLRPRRSGREARGSSNSKGGRGSGPGHGQRRGRGRGRGRG